MTDTPNDPAVIRHEMLAALHRLIEALDRRVPHIERLGEAEIARDATELRQRALRLIRRLED